MKPEDIRRMWHQETPATEQEAADLREQLRTDPEQARRFLNVIYSLSVEHRETAALLKLFMEGMLLRLIEERAATDDAYALECAALITGLMDGMKRPPRGKARTAKSA